MTTIPHLPTEAQMQSRTTAEPLLAAGTQQAVQSSGSPARTRKLHLGHVAFMRAVVQGLDTRQSWDRYLRIEGEHDDIRNVRRTIQWIRDEFAAAARRHDRFGTARLVRIDASRISDSAPNKLPSLEDFAAEHGLLDFSEAEQLEYYQAHYGQHTQSESRRIRVITRQLEALAWLERLVAQPPQADDAVASWLHPDLVSHLETAGIATVRQLIERINGLGLRWWTGIKAIGASKAERIMDWLRTHEPSLGVAIGAHVGVKRKTLRPHELAHVVPPATGIVPLEKLVVPPALDGANGIYRAPQHMCLITATNDYEAVLSWIKTKNGLPAGQPATERDVAAAPAEGLKTGLNNLSHTQRAYRKEAERFLLWAIVQRGRPLSSMTSDDCEAYLSFLVNPAPQQQWCGPRGRERWSPLWRPFEGPLSARARHHAVTILKNLYQYLVDQRYLIGNPWAGIARPKINTRIDKSRSFTASQWEFIEQQLGLLPDTSANRRLRFALHFFYGTGLRLGEAVAAQVDHLAKAASHAGHGWILRVRGKGETERGLPLLQELIDELSVYLASRGLDPDPLSDANRGAFLLGKAVDVADRAPWSPENTRVVDPRAGIAAGTLYAQLKDFFGACAAVLAQSNAKGAQGLAAASTHWLRHTHGSHALASGVPLDVLQKNLGHASPGTTAGYVTSKDEQSWPTLQTFSWQSKKPSA